MERVDLFGAAAILSNSSLKSYLCCLNSWACFSATDLLISSLGILKKYIKRAPLFAQAQIFHGSMYFQAPKITCI